MDLISRQALRETMYHEAFETDSDMQRWDSGCWIRYKMFENAIEAAPTIDPVKHGKWLPHPTEPDWDVCSVCRLGTRRRFHFNDAVYGGYDVEESFAYCPTCGAKMDGGEG